MKLRFLLFINLIGCSLSAQGEYHFTINPNIDTLSQTNSLLIHNLELFLKTKNSDPAANVFWNKSDFEKYKYPYKGIYWIETGWPETDNYFPTLTAIIPTKLKHQYILKLAFIETQNENSAFIKVIYNLMAKVKEDSVIFSSYTDYATKDWEEERIGSFTYLISPERTFSKEDAQKQNDFARQLSRFLEIDEISILYYSCTDSEELFNILGYDYNWQMYLHKTSGQAAFNNILYSGNNRDIYSHEVVHIYLSRYFNSKWNSLLNEGLATYLGGSGELKYKEHRANLAKYIKENPEFDLRKHLNPYDQFFINEDTPDSYTIGALLCEMAFRKGGKELLLKTVAQPENEIAFSFLDISLDNLNERLRNELNKEIVLLVLTD